MKPEELSKPTEQLVDLNPQNFATLPPPYENFKETPLAPLTDDQKNSWEHSLDGVSCLTLPKPQTPEEEEKLVAAFL
ncbi:MAG: (Fe-S)-binding protein, partial [Desulfomonilaceae bacterium]